MAKHLWKAQAHQHARIKNLQATVTRRGSWDYVVFQEADQNIEICQMFHDCTELNEIGEANANLTSAAARTALRKAEGETK